MMHSRMSAFDQPSARNTSACSGATTSIVGALGLFGSPIDCSASASEPASCRAVRLVWSMQTRGPPITGMSVSTS